MILPVKKGIDPAKTPSKNMNAAHVIIYIYIYIYTYIITGATFTLLVPDTYIYIDLRRPPKKSPPFNWSQKKLRGPSFQRVAE